MIVGVAVIAASYRDYGITWDERVHITHGDLLLRYFESGLRDTTCNEFFNLRYYGPLADLIPAALARLLPAFDLESRHLVLALSGLMTVLAVARYGLALGSVAVLVLAPLALLMMPRFYGHAFNNPKDIPLACAFAWSMLAMARMLEGAAIRWSRVLICGLAFGLCLAVRPGAFPILTTLLAAALAWKRVSRGPTATTGERRRSVTTLLATPVLCLGVAWVVMVAAWPWAHASVVSRPLEAMREAARFTSTFPVLFEGRTYMSDRLPWYYLTKYLLITTPPATLLLAGLGLVAAAREQIGRPRSDRAFLMWIVELWLFVPLVVVTVLRVNVYDGLRHFLFVLPAIAVLAGLGGEAVAQRLTGRIPGRVVCVAVLIAIVAPALTMFRLHPYQMTYFNVFVGGVGEAHTAYETDYWTASYKEAIEWVNHEAESSKRPVHVLVAANRFNRLCARYYLADDVRMRTLPDTVDLAELPPPYDFYVATTRYAQDKKFAGAPIVKTIGRDGAVYTVIKAGPTRQPRSR